VVQQDAVGGRTHDGVCRGRSVAGSVLMFKRMICALVLGVSWLVPSPASAQMT
jgi:hypothetical protein